MKRLVSLCSIAISFILVPVAFAQQATEAVPLKVDSGDTAWMLISTALVMFMTPGLAIFYGGMARKKNVLGTIMHSFVALGVVSVVWVLYGYSLAFGPDVAHVIGSLDWAFLNNVGFEPSREYSPTVPHQVFMCFQMMFAVITPALISGAFAERFKFSTYLVFLVLWTTFVYAPLAHWVWGTGGWLREWNVLDFAGGLVIEIASGASSLAAAYVVGRRKGYGHEAMPPHNMPLTIVGVGILWFGWFGFNGGSAIASNGLAGSAFLTTHLGTVAAALAWMIAEWCVSGKPTLLGTASGAVAGLVAMTPASGFIGPMPALATGFVAGLLCYKAVAMKNRFGYDDTLDVVGVHGVGGTWGVIAIGLFASRSVNPAGADGLFFGSATLLGKQVFSVAVAWVFSMVMTYAILKVLDATMGLRVTLEEEIEGLDLTQHGERGYN